MAFGDKELSLGSDQQRLRSTFEQNITELSLKDEVEEVAGDDGDVEMEDVAFMSTPTSSRFKSSLYHPRVSSPLRNESDRGAGDDDGDVDLDVDVDLDLDVNVEDADTSVNSLTRSVSLMFSPTALGAQVATQGSPVLRRVNLAEQLQQCESDDSGLDSTTSDISDASSMGSPASGSSHLRHRAHKPKTASKLSQYVTNSSDEQTTTFDESADSLEDSSAGDMMISSPTKYQTPMVQTPWGQQPIQFQMHHHHYYPSPSRDDSSISNEGQEVVLPAPWSKFASPKAPAPYIISSYLQLMFNALTSAVVIYVLLMAITTIKNDINNKMEEYATEIALEVQRCTRSYLENKCSPETRVSALEQLCTEWERCMNRDPRALANKAAVSAETLGIIVNSLIEPIGVKAIIVVGLLLSGWVFTSNFVFGFLRAKSYYGWQNGNQQQLAMPQQMQTPSNGNLQGYTYQSLTPSSNQLQLQ